MEISNIYKALLRKELLSFRKQAFIVFFSFAIPVMLVAFTLFESVHSFGTNITDEIKSYLITYHKFGAGWIVVPLVMISVSYIISISIINKVSNEYISNLN